MERSIQKTGLFSQFTPRTIILASLITTLIFAAMLAGGLYYYVNAYDKIFPTVSIVHESIEPIEIGGMTKANALELITEKLKRSEDMNITFSYGEKSQTFTASELMLDFDLHNMVEQAYKYGREETGFRSVVDFFIGEHVINTSVIIDDAILENVISSVAGEEESRYISPHYEVKNRRLYLYNGEAGMMADRDEVRKEIANVFTAGSNENNIALTLIPFNPPAFDVDTVYEELTGPPTPAYYHRDYDGNIVVAPSKAQVSLDKGALSKLIEEHEDGASMPITIVSENTTAEELTDKLFRDSLSTYSTTFNPGDVSRTRNVRLAASRINGITLLPGEVISYERALGPRTAENGFYIAAVYVGNKVEDGIGGGICQISSTLYSAALDADMEIVERTNHSLPVAYMPGGRDAAIAAGVIDLKIRNNTKYPIKIVADASGNRASVTILGTLESEREVLILNYSSDPTNFRTLEEYDPNIPIGTKRISQKGMNGITVSTYRVVKKDGVEIKNEFISKSVYLPMDRIEVINPSDVGRDWSIPIVENVEVSEEVPTEVPTEVSEEVQAEVTEEIPGAQNKQVEIPDSQPMPPPGPTVGT